MTLVLKINYPRFAEKNETDDFVQNNMSECLFTILTNIYLFIFSFLYRDELVCSHLDGIFVKKNLSFQLWPLCCCFFTPIISLGCLNPNKDVINHLFRLRGRLVYCLLLHVIRESMKKGSHSD